jgi:hypothetical protein
MLSIALGSLLKAAVFFTVLVTVNISRFFLTACTAVKV